MTADSTQTRTAARASSVSANDTTIPAATSITDNNGNVWKLTHGSVYLNRIRQFDPPATPLQPAGRHDMKMIGSLGLLASAAVQAQVTLPLPAAYPTLLGA
jgi:hypothetical protein